MVIRRLYMPLVVTGKPHILLRSHENPVALFPRLSVDKRAMDFCVHAMRARVLPVTTDLTTV